MPIIVNLDVMIAPGDNLEHVKKKKLFQCNYLLVYLAFNFIALLNTNL